MPPRSPVAVNASILGPAASGRGQYTLGLVRSLDALREGLVVYTSCPEVLSVSGRDGTTDIFAHKT